MDVFAATKIQQSLLSDVQHAQTKEKKRLTKGYFFNFKTGFVINIVNILGVNVKSVYSIV